MNEEWKGVLEAPAIGKFEVLLRRHEDGSEETAIAERRNGVWLVNGNSAIVHGWRARK